MKISIETIPHANQRYDTAGDWVFESDGSLNINISEMADERSEIAVAIHELFEALACRRIGITAEDVDKWDLHYEGPNDEPGEDPRCPYHAQHMQAEQIEMLTCKMLGIDWKHHCEIMKLLWRVDNDK